MSSKLVPQPWGMPGHPM